jgi:hypothetical protein
MPALRQLTRIIQAGLDAALDETERLRRARGTRPGASAPARAWAPSSSSTESATDPGAPARILTPCALLRDVTVDQRVGWAWMSIRA